MDKEVVGFYDKENRIERQRYDFFLVWGNGLPYLEEMIEMIEMDSRFEILKVISYAPSNIKKFVKDVYSYDYAPYFHLKGKTQYLHKTVSKTCFIFVRNLEPMEFVKDSWDGTFPHIESQSMNEMKNAIRDRFNERKEDRRTENHVVHGSDNEEQTEMMLKYLGYAGLPALWEDGCFLLPRHIDHYNKYILKSVDIIELYANIVERDNSGKPIFKLMHLQETPHYRALKEDMGIYNEYLCRNRGESLRDYYSIMKFRNLFNNFDEISYLKNARYIVVRRLDNRLVILDGVHRATVMLKKGIRTTIVIEVVN